MPRQNRVTPFGELIAVPERGGWMGNRGCLHNDRGGITRRRWTTYSWVTCKLAFHGRHRTLMQPRRYTELFFLDEATACAAGHRPCGECRHDDYRVFKSLWLAANCPELAEDSTPIANIDRILHRERVADWQNSATHSNQFAYDFLGQAVERARTPERVYQHWAQLPHASRRWQTTTLLHPDGSVMRQLFGTTVASKRP